MLKHLAAAKASNAITEGANRDVYTHNFICEGCKLKFKLTYCAPIIEGGTFSFCPTCDAVKWATIDGGRI